MFVNGRKTSLGDFRKISSYVEQDDTLVGSLTVRETMYFAAQLSLPRFVTHDRLQQYDVNTCYS
jgi:ABC-type multidrug transport system ATPase subunit